MTERWWNWPPEDKDDDLKTGSDRGGRPENGAPVAAVTGTPQAGGRAKPLGSHPTKRKGAPRKAKRVPVKKRGMLKIPSAKDLFG